MQVAAGEVEGQSQTGLFGPFDGVDDSANDLGRTLGELCHVVAGMIGLSGVILKHSQSD